MIVILKPSKSEFNKDPCAEIVKDEEALLHWIKHYQGSLAGIRFIRGTEMTLELCLEEKRDA